MGTGASKNSDSSSHGGEEREDQAGGQLYVSLKMENYRLKGELVPHVFGSAPLVGSWDSSKALSMERESTSMWELSFVVPPNHETLDFKFLLKPKDSNTPCIVEEGANRILSGGRLQGDARAALFRLNADAVLEYRVCIKADRVSPFDLAASWRAYQENLQPSAVRGIPDVSINSVPESDAEEMEVIIPDPAKIHATSPVIETKAVGTASSLQKQESHKGLFVDRAAGAVAAAAVADQMLGPKEDRHLALVLTADIFRADNPEGMEARNEVASLAMEDMISWMQEGGQVGIVDATNSTRERRNMLMKMAEGKCKGLWKTSVFGAYDRAAIEFRGVDADINFNISDYEDIKQMENFSKEEFVHILRRQSTGFSRGSSKYRGVTLHKCGRWEARMG